jgi:hypothetical protein
MTQDLRASSFVLRRSVLFVQGDQNFCFALRCLSLPHFGLPFGLLRFEPRQRIAPRYLKGRNVKPFANAPLLVRGIRRQPTPACPTTLRLSVARNSASAQAKVAF